MKNSGFAVLVVTILLGWTACKKSGGKDSETKASIEFDTTSFYFGQIAYSSDAEFEFEFTNTGSAPLLVTHVKSTCGCTVPEWSKKPVEAGKKGKIRVSYDTHRVGAFNKSIYVYSNAENGVKRLTISGKVRPSDIKP
jgi:hypothetical protein